LNVVASGLALAKQGATVAVARDLAPRGITVNVVSVGAVDTDLNPSDSAAADWQRAAMAVDGGWGS
jgi:3-oxoacyl-[acyl-carrier protein] reductase